MNWFAKMWKACHEKIGARSLNCREATRLQSDALDRSLGPGQRIGLRIHLVFCKWCRRYGKQIGFLRSAAHRHDEHESCLPPRSLTPEARGRIKGRLRVDEK